MDDRPAPRRILASVDDVLTAVGAPLGASGWHRITQREIDAFAEGTGNFAPNHTDPAYAAGTPLRVTIAFGMQILAMATLVLSDLWELRNVTSGADYGCNRVRHLAPVPVDSRVRATATIAAAEPVGGDGVRLTTDLEFEVEGGTRPVCVAQVVNLLHFAPA
jgi:acyl dehydratase